MPEEDDADNDDESANQKTKAKLGRKQGAKTKANPPEVENENGNPSISS